MNLMKKNVITTILLQFISSMIFSQNIPEDSLYFGQTPPGDSAIIFAPGKISLPGRNEPCITFSPDGKTVFFYIEFYPNPGTPFIMFSEYKNDQWTVPDTIPFTVGRITGEPFLACNGNRLYMFASNAVNHQGVVDLSYSERQGDVWTTPISLGNPPNAESYQYHPCIVADTSIYFSSQTGYICRSQYNNGVYQNKVILPKPINYIGTQTWGDSYVSSNEEYMIFKSIRPGGYGQHDIYISYKKPDGKWTNPKNLGNKINTPYDETSGDITPDGNYMTFGSNKDLYWVSTSFIDSLKYTNYIPYLKNSIPDQAATIGQQFSFTISDTAFIDDDGNHTLSFSAKQFDGTPLPTWLSFDSVLKTFSGTPDSSGNLVIKVTATDTAGASASTKFTIAVNNLGINTIEGQNIEIFPNPTKGEINILLGNLSNNLVVVEVSSLEGKILSSSSYEKKSEIALDLSGNPNGIYILRININGGNFFRKICIQ